MVSSLSAFISVASLLSLAQGARTKPRVQRRGGGSESPSPSGKKYDPFADGAPSGVLSSKKVYRCDDGSSYAMTPVEGNDNRWFENMFVLDPAEKATLNKGQDVAVGREPYSSIQFKAAWRVSGANDAARFAAAQKEPFSKSVDRVTELMAEKKKRIGSVEARDIAAQKTVKGVRALDTAIQRLDGYPWTSRHPTNTQLNGSLAYFLHGTKPWALPLIFCNGLRAGNSGLFGQAVYLSDKAAKVDQYAGDDCERTDGGSCRYVIDTAEAETGPGYPAVSGAFDRSIPVQYALVVAVTPFRIAYDYAIKNGMKGRANERQLFWIPSNRSWVDHPFNFSERTLYTPERTSIWDKYQFVYALAKAPHRNLVDQIMSHWPGWLPILDRYDEFFMHDASLTRVDYLIAYQRV